jgi:pyruvate dehydrogenase E1 component
VPNCISYDPTYAYELAVIVHDGLRRMYSEQENIFYYLTVTNENYAHPPLLKNSEEGILKGIYCLRSSKATKQPRVQLLGSGAIVREVVAAADMLSADFGVAADVWSVTSFTQLRRDGLAAERWNRLHPEETQRRPYITTQLEGHEGPIVAATDYMRTYAEQVRAFLPRPYTVLGTDGFGRSDTRDALRDFFEVDRRWVAAAALKALADEGKIKPKAVSDALRKLKIDTERPDPWTR